MEIATLIVRIGADMADLLSESKKATSALGGIEKSVASVGKLLTTYFGAQMILGALSSVVEMAGALSDLSAQTGITVEGLQELKIAGGQVGLSLEQTTGVITKMQDKLSSGDKSALAAVRDLGVSLDDLAKQAPDQQFLTMARALKEVQDPAEQIRMSIDLFGKSGPEALKLVNSEFDATIQKARDLGLVLDRETIGALDDMGDSLDIMKTALQAGLANLLVELTPALLDVGNAVVGMSGYLRDGLQWINSWETSVDSAANALRGLFGAAPIDYAGIRKAADDAAQLKRETEDAAAAAARGKASYDGQAEALAKSKKDAEELKRHVKEIADIRDKMSGRDIAHDMSNALEAMGGKLPKLKAAQEDFIALWGRYKTVVEQTGGSLDGMYAKAQAAAREMQGLSPAGLLVPKKVTLGAAQYTAVAPSYEKTNVELAQYLKLKQDQRQSDTESEASTRALEKENIAYIESLNKIAPAIDTQVPAWKRASQAAFGFAGQVKATHDEFMAAFDDMWRKQGESELGVMGGGISAMTGSGVGTRWRPRGFSTGTDGYENFGTGTPAMLHGWEKVTPMGKGGGDGATAITVNMSGMVLSNNPSAREDLRRVVNDAIASGVKRSRKFSY